jgi:hypothetical protein
VTTPNPAPDERANGWRATDRPYPSTDWSAPDPADPSAVPAGSLGPAGSPGPAGSLGPAVGRAFVPAPPFPTRGPLVRLPEVLAALTVAAVLALSGFPLGWLWSAVAPHTPVQMVPEGAVLSQPEQEQMIADEGLYLFLTVLAGVLVAALAWAFLRRYRGVPMVLGLALGGAIGGAVTAWFGHSIGYAHFKELATKAPVGTSFLAPVNLRVKQIGWWHHVVPYARGDVLAMAIAALVVYLLLAGFSPYPSLREPDPAPLTDFGSPGNGYPGAAYPGTTHAGQFGEVGPGTISSDS